MVRDSVRHRSIRGSDLLLISRVGISRLRSFRILANGWNLAGNSKVKVLETGQSCVLNEGS